MINLACILDAFERENPIHPSSPTNTVGNQFLFFAVLKMHATCTFLLSVASVGHSVHIICIKSTQSHIRKYIPVVHSGNSAHSGKRMGVEVLISCES